MNGCDENRIQDLILESLPLAERDEAERHISSCPACRRKAEQYRRLFRELTLLPFPPVPGGIADAVLSRLGPAPVSLARYRRAPALAMGTLAMLGLLMAVFHRPVLLAIGRLTGDFATEFATGLVAMVRDLLSKSSEVAVFLRLIVDAVVRLEALGRVVGEALLTVSDRTTSGTFVLSLATVLLLGRLLGQIRKEKYGSAKY